jgi:hypothetical protein
MKYSIYQVAKIIDAMPTDLNETAISIYLLTAVRSFPRRNIILCP